MVTKLYRFVILFFEVWLFSVRFAISVNRPAGIPITKPRTIDADFYKHLLLMPGGVIATAKEKMPWMRGRRLKIQHDGARPHTAGGLEDEVHAVSSTEGWHISMVRQPAQSPDLNIMDLGLFHSLKVHVIQLKEGAHNIDHLIQKVRTVFESYPSHTLDSIWGHQVACWNSVLHAMGSNQYKAPHHGGTVLQKEEGSAVDLNIDADAYNAAIDFVYG